ncbi:MAG: ATP-binding cassette domain-containing protein [Nitriliruptor sp.]|nr:MAG: ATP-binding cassette domain-containing protein [Nitriliruptor sp.]
MTDAAVVVDGLTERFGADLAVDDVSFEVPAGRIVDGVGFHPGRRAIDELRICGAAGGLPSARCDEVLELVGLAQVGRKRVGTDSLGMKQRLGLAAAMLGDPQVLLLDEPANGLDPEGLQWVRGFLRHLLGEVASQDDAVLAEALQRRGGQVTEVDGMLQVVGLQPMEVGTAAVFTFATAVTGAQFTGSDADVAVAIDQIGSNSVIVLVVALLAMTTEFRHGTAGRTFQVAPSRTRVLVAKMLVGAGYATVFLLAVAIGALIRSQVVALTAMLVWVFIVEQLVSFAAPRVGQWLPFNALNAVFVSAEARQGVPDGMMVLLEPAVGLATFLGYVVVTAAAAILLLRTRDV